MSSNDERFLPTDVHEPPSVLLEMIKRGIVLEDRRYKGSKRAIQRAEEQTRLVAGMVKELTILLVRQSIEK